jgi:putative transposase
VAKLMKKEGIWSRIKKWYKITTDSTYHYPVADNILSCSFAVKEKGTTWVSDITYIRTSEGWPYLAIILDLADRKVIG